MAIKAFLSSTVGRKEVLGVTGLALSLFVFAHMMGNLLLFVGPAAYNLYGHALTSGPLYYIMEVGLTLLFLMHMGLAVRLAILNRKARPVGYMREPHGDKGIPAISKVMLQQGIVIFMFVVSHIVTFRLGPNYIISHDGKAVRDLYRLVIEVFQDPIYVAGYSIVMVTIGFHIGHGIYSSFQSLGWTQARFDHGLRMFSRAVGGAIAAGFIAQPIYAYFFGGNL